MNNQLFVNNDRDNHHIKFKQLIRKKGAMNWDINFYYLFLRFIPIIIRLFLFWKKSIEKMYNNIFFSLQVLQENT